VASAARELGLELSQPASVNEPDAVARIAQADPEAVCVCAFGALIKEPLLSAYPMLNVHPSLLPRWRGAAPVERAIMAGDERTGVSIMRLTAGLDSGPVSLQAAEPIDPADTYGTLAGRLERLGGELLVRALDSPEPWNEQDDALATYADKITAEDRVLDPRRPAVELERVVRALNPHIGARFELADGTWLGVREVLALTQEELGSGGVPAPPPAGTLSLAGARPVLGCSPGALEFVTVQPPGRRAMAAEEFLRGYRG
jgi:methionyl-tRNA formyltransferase